tara:strand:- start:13958 stop:14548 length:591 start_codon:yes stop_codon:yes gene_type:complete
MESNESDDSSDCIKSDNIKSNDIQSTIDKSNDNFPIQDKSCKVETNQYSQTDKPTPKSKLNLRRRNLTVFSNNINKISNNIGKNDFDTNRIDKSNIKLSLIRKPRNSPFLSIQTYLYNCIRENREISSIRSLWDKYRKQSIYSTIIAQHHLNYEIFKDIARTVLNSIESYQLSITPTINTINEPRLTSFDLVDYNI